MEKGNILKEQATQAQKENSLLKALIDNMREFNERVSKLLKNF